MVDWFYFGLWEPINTLVQLLYIQARSLRLGRSRKASFGKLLMMERFLVVDLEATCCDDSSFPRTEMEIVKIGAVMVCPSTHQPLGEFQTFIQPVLHPILTGFCRELTNISQAQVDSAPSFADALASFLDWANGFAPFVFCSWGNYDRTQFESDCIQHKVAYPFGDRHINFKAEFAKANGRRKKLGVPAALRSVGLTFSGSHHRGIDDARNIASLIPCIFPPSSNVGGS